MIYQLSISQSNERITEYGYTTRTRKSVFSATFGMSSATVLSPSDCYWMDKKLGQIAYV